MALRASLIVSAFSDLLSFSASMLVMHLYHLVPCCQSTGKALLPHVTSVTYATYALRCSMDLNAYRSIQKPSRSNAERNRIERHLSTSLRMLFVANPRCKVGMFSWFPMFFPLRHPQYLPKGSIIRRLNEQSFAKSSEQNL